MEEKTLIEAVVVYPRRADGAVLLAEKRMKIGEGCLNGYGGGREQGETLLQTAVRELHEESGLVVQEKHLEKIALLRSYNHKSDGRIVLCDVHFYCADHCEGVPQSTSEMANPTWFTADKIPLNRLMPADAAWVPRALAGEKLIVTVHYGPFQKEVLEPVVIKIVDSF